MFNAPLVLSFIESFHLAMANKRFIWSIFGALFPGMTKYVRVPDMLELNLFTFGCLKNGPSQTALTSPEESRRASLAGVTISRLPAGAIPQILCYGEVSSSRPFFNEHLLANISNLREYRAGILGRPVTGEESIKALHSLTRSKQSAHTNARDSSIDVFLAKMCQLERGLTAMQLKYGASFPVEELLASHLESAEIGTIEQFEKACATAMINLKPQVEYEILPTRASLIFAGAFGEFEKAENILDAFFGKNKILAKEHELLLSSFPLLHTLYLNGHFQLLV